MAANLELRCRFEHRPRLHLIGEDLTVDNASLKLNHDIGHGDGDDAVDNDDGEDSVDGEGTALDWKRPHGGWKEPPLR